LEEVVDLLAAEPVRARRGAIAAVAGADQPTALAEQRQAQILGPTAVDVLFAGGTQAARDGRNAHWAIFECVFADPPIRAAFVLTFEASLSTHPTTARVRHALIALAVIA
jgi:16S rRNA G966 N2-methylase RsmD